MQARASGVLALVLTASLAAQNSTQKIRPAPSAMAARAGSAVQWRRTLDLAMRESRSTGKPVFWYIPSVVGSPMDRRAEINLYMMAGPFSWPSTIELLNEFFVPVKQVPTGPQQRDRKLRPGEFIEPGYLVLDREGEEIYRLDKITSLHPRWFEMPLLELTDTVGALGPGAAVSHLWELGFEEPETLDPDDQPRGLRAYHLYLKGAVHFRKKEDQLAYTAWRDLIRRFPGNPLAWKAAAEIEGHGPFSRGFEDYWALPEGAVTGARDGSRAPAGVYTEDQLWRRSVRYLTTMIRPGGGYLDSRYDFGGTDSLPNVHMACTAIVGEALLEARLRGLDDLPDALDVHLALGEIHPYTIDDTNINPDDTDEIIWAHLYRARFLARTIELHPDTADNLAPHLQRVVDAIEDLQPESGAWFHEYSNPFTIAAVLIALKRASHAGAAVSQEHVDRGILALLRARAQNGAFSYGYGGSPEGTRIPAAAGRMPLCELALSLWGEGRPGALENALRAAFQHHQELEDTRKYDDHAGPYAYGGFFFWFDMHARTEAIASLPDGALKTRLKKMQRDLLLSLPELDGCFVDSHELGRTYGTAMALLCFAALR